MGICLGLQAFPGRAHQLAACPWVFIPHPYQWEIICMGANHAPWVPLSSPLGPLLADITGNKSEWLQSHPGMAPEQQVSPSRNQMARCRTVIGLMQRLNMACPPGMCRPSGQQVPRARLLLLAGKLPSACWRAARPRHTTLLHCQVPQAVQLLLAGNLPPACLRPAGPCHMKVPHCQASKQQQQLVMIGSMCLGTTALALRATGPI